MMCLPEQFVKSGVQAQDDTIQALNTYFKLVKFNKNCIVMDIGCGPGNVTNDLIHPALPKSMKALIGSDISKNMIEFAKKQHVNKTNLHFFEMDITTDNIPKDFIGLFDHVVSFYCFHLVFDHRKALRNIYQLLKPGGSIFINFMGNSVVFDTYKLLSEDPKWKVYFQDVNVAPPTQNFEDPAKEFQNLLTETGFDTQFCVSTKKDYKYTKETFRSLILAVKHFELPKSLEDSYISYLKEDLIRRGHFSTDLEGSKYYHTPYTLLTVSAIKPI